RSKRDWSSDVCSSDLLGGDLYFYLVCSLSTGWHLYRCDPDTANAQCHYPGPTVLCSAVYAVNSPLGQPRVMDSFYWLCGGPRHRAWRLLPGTAAPSERPDGLLSALFEYSHGR